MHPLTRRLNRLFVAVHHWVYERSGGRIGSSLAGRPMLMLYTVGRKSGQRRSSVLPYIRDGDGFVVVASNYGQTRHPAWYLNALANPDVEAQIGRERLALRARVADGEERQRLWDAADAVNRGNYANYQRTAGGREIPVVVLERR